MLFLVIMALVISAYVEDADCAKAPPPQWWLITAFAAAAVVLVWILTGLLARRTASSVQSAADDLGRRAVAHHHLLWGLRGLILGLYLWLVFAAGWPAFVYQSLGLANWLVIDNWVVILPFVGMVVAHWKALYRVDILFRQRQASSAALQPMSGVPLEPFRPWSLGQYLGHHVRHYILVVVVPVSVWWAGLDVLRWLLPRLGVADGGWHLIPAVAWVVGVYAVSPLFMRVIWSTRRLPDGALRRRLDALCRQTGLRYRDILIWRTRCDVVNAAVAGVLGGLRFIFLTDGLLRHLRPDEIEAVFAHEIGHVRHRHIPLYLIFAGGSVVFVLALYQLVEVVNGAVGGSAELVRRLTEGWPFLLAALALYWGVLFGYLSRRFERQADIFAIRAVSSHGEATAGAGSWVGQPPPAAKEPQARAPAPHKNPKSRIQNQMRPLDPVALGRFTRALETVARLNGMTRNVAGWTHFSISRRVWFLEQALVNPWVEWRFQRTLRRLKWAWLTAALIGLAFLAWQQGRPSGFSDQVSRLGCPKSTSAAAKS